MRKKVLGLACAMMMTAFLTACGISDVTGKSSSSGNLSQKELTNPTVSASVVHHPPGKPA